MTLSTGATLDIAVLEDAGGFAALEEEWDELYRRSRCATPFQSWAWLYSWWEHYGEGYRLRLVVLRDGVGTLVGLLPLMLERRGGLDRLLFVGTGLTDHLDVLAEAGREAEVAEACRVALGQMDDWRLADLQELRPEAAAWGVFRNWPGLRRSIWQSNCLVVETRPWEELVMHLSRNRREKARKTIRRAKQDGVHCEPAGLEEVERAARRWLALHREYWQDRGITQEHLTERFGTHMEAAAKRMSASGAGAVYEFWRGGEVVASDFVTTGRDYVASYLQGANEYALRRFQVSSLFMWNWINVALDRGVPTVSMLRGEEPYKFRWEPSVAANHRVILGRDRVSFGFYAGYHAARSKAARYAKSEAAPRWIKGAADRLKGRLPS